MAAPAPAWRRAGGERARWRYLSAVRIVCGVPSRRASALAIGAMITMWSTFPGLSSATRAYGADGRSSQLGQRPLALHPKGVSDPPSGGSGEQGFKRKGRRQPPSLSVKVLVDESTSGTRRASLSLMTIAPGNRLAMHKHPGTEMLYVKNGRARVVGPRGLKPEEIPRGTAIFIPAGMPHAIENMVRTAPAEILQVFAPAGPERVYRDPEDAAGRAAFEIVPDLRDAAVPSGARFVVTSFDRASAYPQGDRKWTVHLLFEPRDTDSPAASMAIVEVAPGGEIPRHRHDRSDTILYILSGTGEIETGNGRVPFAPDQALHLPSGVPHGVKCAGPRKVVALVIYAPAGPEQQWKEGAWPSWIRTDASPTRLSGGHRGL